MTDADESERLRADLKAERALYQHDIPRLLDDNKRLRIENAALMAERDDGVNAEIERLHKLLSEALERIPSWSTGVNDAILEEIRAVLTEHALRSPSKDDVRRALEGKE